jgi:hypothetical protein
MAPNGIPDGSGLRRLLEPDEQLHVRAEATDAVMLVTDRRVAVSVNDRLSLAVPFEGLRRVQFDIERERHATLVLVPDAPRDIPQVLVIPPEQYAAVGEALAIIGRRFAESGQSA